MSGCCAERSRGRPVASVAPSVPLEVWLGYASLGIPVVPEHAPDPRSPTGCDCGRRECRKPGKHPRTPNGSLDATTEEATIRRRLGVWPRANIGTALEKADLVIVGPDCPRWLDEFARRGLPPTPVARSGGGDGHLHYFYRRPAGCPQTRICKPDQYDILAKGNAILAPSLHASGRRYEWLVPIESLAQLAELPAWAVAELRARGEGGATTPAALPADLQPVPLAALRVPDWTRRLIREGRDADPERYASRSEALWKAIRKLVATGHSNAVVAAVLLDPANAVGEKAREQGRRWLAAEIGRARAKRQPARLTVPEKSGGPSHIKVRVA